MERYPRGVYAEGISYQQGFIMSQAQERRRYTRIQFDGKTTLYQADKSWSVSLVDISLKGALAHTKDQHLPNTDNPIKLHIQLAGDITIDMQTELAHTHDNYLGLHCISIDMDSIAHLRRLIELNIEDPHASERVLEELLIMP